MLTTAANIVTNVLTNLDSTKIASADIEAVEQLRIRQGLIETYGRDDGIAIYDVIIADFAEDSPSYGTLEGYLASALEYFVSADVFERINSVIEVRGVFTQNAETATNVTDETKKTIKAELLKLGYGYFEKAINWINENWSTDYTNVPMEDWEWTDLSGYNYDYKKRTNVI